MQRFIVNFLKFLLFLGIGVLILFLLYRHQNAAFQAECALKGIPNEECNLMDKVLYDFSTVKISWLFLVLCAQYIAPLNHHELPLKGDLF